MTTWPNHIVIVGGGTAGWLAALVLQDAAKRDGHRTAFSVIESSKIGTIGVGEGSTAVFRQLLNHLTLDEEEFLRETGATIKYGIRHKDWRRKGHHYDGPIDDPQAVTGPGLDLYAIGAGRPVSETHLFQHLMDKRRAPVASANGQTVPAGPFHHAYHFDQALAGRWLKTKAAGVHLLDDQVVGVETGEGGITGLVLESGARVEADFFLDCTGFRRALISALGAEWIDYGDVLPVNRAMPFWIDYKDGEEIDPFTLAWAQGSGWMWRIPTRDRSGCGYVYSDAHISPDEAKAEIEAALGQPVEPRADIRINAGRLRDAWIANCVAIGLSSSFLEPLEATSIHGTIVQLMMLVAGMGRAGANKQYNAAVAAQVDDFRDFIRLHYMTERRDTAFWKDVAASHPIVLQDKLSLWQTRLPLRTDFSPLPMGLPHIERQMLVPVLDGLGLLNRQSAKQELAKSPKWRAELRKSHREIIGEYKRAAGQCLHHHAYLESLSKETIQ